MQFVPDIDFPGATVPNSDKDRQARRSSVSVIPTLRNALEQTKYDSSLVAFDMTAVTVDITALLASFPDSLPTDANIAAFYTNPKSNVQLQLTELE